MSARNRPVAAIYGLSPMQEGILYEALAEDDAGMYLTQSVYDLASPDPGTLRAALERVVERHTALRTCFVWEGRPAPLQAVLHEARPSWEEHDWRELPAAEQEERLAAFLAADRRRGLDLRQAPLLRVAAFHCAGGTMRLVWTFHHIVIDGWSLRLLLAEVAAVYAEIAAGMPAELPPARPFGDYIAWLAGRRKEEAEAFWRERLAGFSAPTPLPVDALDAVPPAPGDDPADPYPQHEQILAADVTRALLAFARQHGLTLSTLLQGVWAILLARHAGRDDVLFGVVVTGRPSDLAGIDRMVGLFINNLPLRVRAAAGAPVVGWLQALQADQAAAREHQHTPLRTAHGLSDVPRSLPLFHTYVNIFGRSQAWEADRAGAAAAPAALRATGGRSIIQASSPLTLVAAEEGGALNLRLCYERRRIATPAVERLQRQLAALLCGLAAAAGRTLGELSLLSPAEQRQLSAAVAGRGGVLPAAASVPELFAAAAAAVPESVAVADGDRKLTYGELDRLSNQLARALARRGVAPGTRVALCVERSCLAVAALLAVQKAGAAYVALEPADPAARRGALLRQARPRLVLTRGGGAAAESSDLAAAAESWDLDAAAAAAAAEPCDRLPGWPPPEALAYVLFTSGSTGTPKGVAVEHRQICHYVAAVREALDLAPGMRYAMVTTLAADLGHTCLYPALLTGGTLHLVPRERAMDAAGLAAVVRGERIDCLKITPSHLGALLAAPRAADLLPAARLVLGGEALRWDDVRRLHALAPRCRIFNHYGPTETTVGVATWEVPRHDGGRHSPGGDAGVPLGRPLAHARLVVLDHHGQPAPEGLAGELAAGGLGVARGYLDDPRATAERFLPDPTAGTPGARLYRTGDRVRRLADGNLEFCGRLDHQVKVRGFRVELGEIEAALRAHPRVGDAVAAVRGAGADLRIVAWVCGRDGTAPDGAVLAAHLAELLPAAALPAHIATLAALPLTANGKVDRQALPDPAAHGAGGGRTAPRSGLERDLAAVWCEVLGVPEVGVEDNFFDLGGHSLRAMQLITRLRRQLAVALSLREFLAAPTVAGLAVTIVRKQAAQVPAGEVARLLDELEGLSQEQLGG